MTSKLKRHFEQFATGVLVAALGASAYVVAAVSFPDFTTGTMISASEMNAKLNALKNAVNTIPAGPPGPAGPAGPIGPTGPAGALKSVSFTFANVCTNAAGCVGPLGSITFTAPAAGNVLAVASGYCNLNNTLAHEINIAFETVNNALSAPVSDWWVYRTTGATPLTALPLVSSRTFPVVSGLNTLFLNAKNNNNVTGTNCGATITVSFAAQTMP